MIELYQRSAKFTELRPYCHHSKPGDFMEYCEWSNGEGFDVTVDKKHFSLTYGEWEALQALVNYKE